jgi:hypothetical protein
MYQSFDVFKIKYERLYIMYGKFMYMRLFAFENAIFDCYHVGYAWLLFRSLHQSPLMLTHCQTYHQI